MSHPTLPARASQPLVFRALLALGAGWVGACGGGGGGGSSGGSPEFVVLEAEPNDTPAGAVELLVGQPGQGSLAQPGDVDWWRIELARDELVQLEVFATRADQPNWDDASPGSVPSIPRIDVFLPDAATLWRTHDFQSGAAQGAPSFEHRPQDFDFSFLRAPADGVYFVSIRPIAGTPSGGAYILRARKAAFGAAQRELENAGVSGVNDTPASAQPLQPGALFGAQSSADLDLYSFQISAPTLVSFDLHAERGGMAGGAGDYLDLALRLIGTDGATELACSDNVHFNDPRLERSLSVPGTYFLEVSQARGSTTGEYMLVHARQPIAAGVVELEANNSPAQAQSIALGAWIEGALAPGDDDWFGINVTAGDMLEVQVLDGSNSDDRSGVAVPGLVRPDGVTALQAGGAWSGRKLSGVIGESGVHFVQMTHDGAPASYRFRARVVRASSFESEPNNSPAQAPTLASGQRYAGALVDATDRDWYRIDAEAGKLVVLQCYGGWAINGGSGERGSWGSSVAPYLILHDDAPTPNELNQSTTDVEFCTTEGIAELEPAVALAFISPVNATFYLSVQDAQSRESIDHLYVIERR